MQQLALEYLDFADKSLASLGSKGLKLSDSFLEAALSLASARLNRFTSKHTSQDTIQVHELKLQLAARQLLAESSDAKEVAVVTLAAEKPDDPKLMEFLFVLASFKL